jgi:hypothetical protein
LTSAARIHTIAGAMSHVANSNVSNQGDALVSTPITGGKNVEVRNLPPPPAIANGSAGKDVRGKILESRDVIQKNDDQWTSKLPDGKALEGNQSAAAVKVELAREEIAEIRRQIDKEIDKLQKEIIDQYGEVEGKKIIEGIHKSAEERCAKELETGKDGEKELPSGSDVTRALSTKNSEIEDSIANLGALFKRLAEQQKKFKEAEDELIVLMYRNICSCEGSCSDSEGSPSEGEFKPDEKEISKAYEWAKQLKEAGAQDASVSDVAAIDKQIEETATSITKKIEEVTNMKEADTSSAGTEADKVTKRHKNLESSLVEIIVLVATYDNNITKRAEAGAEMINAVFDSASNANKDPDDTSTLPHCQQLPSTLPLPPLPSLDVKSDTSTLPLPTLPSTLPPLPSAAAAIVQGADEPLPTGEGR